MPNIAAARFLFKGGQCACAMLASVILNHASEASPNESAGLQIRIEQVSPQGGDLLIAIYDRASYDGHDGNALRDVKVAAHAPETVVTVGDLKPGRYAIKMFQDVKRTGVFAMSSFGVPAEPYGFSNDAIPLLDQPSFDSASFEYSGKPIELVVHLRAGF